MGGAPRKLPYHFPQEQYMKLPLWRRRREEELEEEIQSHLQMAIRDRIDRGESADEAELAARREFGNLGLIKETTRGMWGWTQAKLIFDDMRYGLRMLRKSPGWTAVMCAVLALGIGLTTAIFSLAYGILLRALPYPDPERIVALYYTNTVAAAGRALKTQLFGVGSADAIAFIVAPALLLVTGLLAGLGPARRAGRVDPAVTLRSE
jgi:hypothetical protein